ncbi:MAG: permease [Planctomycetota bacterium]|jgi:uncharacterized membrane protein YraQ (UPF0718 family)
MELIKLFFSGIWDIFLLLAPLLLIGLLMAGMLHILIPGRLIQRVPIAIELNRKGASKPSTMSFLITTPESGTDSILITWGLLGPFMAITRPIASFFSALVAGVFTIGLLRDNVSMDLKRQKDSGGDSGCQERCQEDHEYDSFESEENYVGIPGLWLSIKSYFRGKNEKVVKATDKPVSTATDSIPLSQIFKRIWRYAFIEMADDIVFSLVVGLLLAGLIIVVIPENLAMYGLGKGIIPMLIMLTASVPLYMCASASTPIAAALIAKGISPGAAMVFLLAGPATNATTIVMLTKQFGGGFVRIYLGSIIAGALISGYIFDYLLVLFGLQIIPDVSMGDNFVIGTFQWIAAFLLIALMAWRFCRGAAKKGIKDITNNTLILLFKKIRGTKTKSKY